MLPRDFLVQIASEYKLSPDQEAVFLRRLGENKSYDEVARELNTSGSACQKRMGQVYHKFGIGGGAKGKESRLKAFLRNRLQPGTEDSEFRRADPERPARLQDWGDAPDVSVFYGRTEELKTLQQWIVKDRCRLVAVLGMVGIGKTAVSVKLGLQVRDDFECVIWRSLRDLPGTDTRSDPLLEDLLKFLAPDVKLPAQFNARVALLMECLKTRRCLLFLDDVQTILQPGDPYMRYRQDYRDYGELFRRVGEENHQSCLVLLSREKVREIHIMEGPELPVRALILAGLKTDEARHILDSKNLSGEQNWNELIAMYEGNPLTLKVIGQTIQDVFDGRVTEFLKLQTLNLSLMGDIFEPHLNRLSDLEKQVLGQISEENRPISFEELRKKFSDNNVRNSDLIVALNSLERRSILEKESREGGVDSTPAFKPISLFKEYITKKLTRLLKNN